MAKGWEASGMNQRNYCQSHSISYSVFKYRRRALSESLSAGPKQIRTKFIELQTEPQTDSDSSQIQITYPNGVQISVCSSMNIDRIAVLATSYKSN